MHFHHLHFYVNELGFWQRWFCDKLAFHTVASPDVPTVRSPAHNSSIESSVVLRHGQIEVRLSAPGNRLSTPKHPPEDSQGNSINPLSRATGTSEVSQYLKQHPPGLVDIAFATEHFDAVLTRSLQKGAVVLTPVHINDQGNRQCQLQGWQHLRHTLIEVPPDWTHHNLTPASQSSTRWLSAIDHVVLNVPKGELAVAAAWYQKVFGLIPSQKFKITTARSGLSSQVLVHPEGTLQLPINEPTSNNSQIQEFLNHNRGAGIQHVALRSQDAVGAIAQFRQQGLNLLNVPATYYDNLPQRADCPLQDFSAIQQQQLLIDWPQG
ncbi:MAG: VOC family protein, partial [Cyanobacteria bacterium J06649_4]